MSSLNNRPPSGTILLRPNVVPLDAVSRLSGVNFNSVLKVFAAIEMIHRADPDIDLKRFMSFSLTPKTACVQDEEHGVKRMELTTEFLRKVLSEIDRPTDIELDSVLNHIGRLRHDLLSQNKSPVRA